MNDDKPEQWEARPVPGMNCIFITEVGMMHSHAHVTSATDTPQALTDLEHQRAALIADAPAMLRALLALLNATPTGQQKTAAWLAAQKLVLAHT